MKRHLRFQTLLLTWYREKKRSLPWRDTLDPYAILVSEMMLQQTSVSRVVPYFRRFLERFPTLSDLAKASEKEVLRMWEGLGYYSRARNLHRAAQKILEEKGGIIPDSVEELQKFPGIGPYTAGAVASLACNRRVPVLDGNVTRVLTRLFRVEGDPKSGPIRRRLRELAETLLPEGETRDFNAALMELGELICSPSRPRCPECPVNTLCEAFRHNDVSRFPESSSSSTTLHVVDVAVFVEREGKVLLTQRPQKGVWGGLWELPRVRVLEGETLEEAAHRATESVCGIRIHVKESLGVIHHRVTRYQIRLHGFRGEWESGEEKPISCVSASWIPKEQLGDYPLPSPQRRLLSSVRRCRNVGF